jgi:hypothetical protein
VLINRKISEFNAEELSISSIRELDKIDKLINEETNHKEESEEEQFKENCQTIDLMIKLN